jgi:hypothetical protein
MTNSTARRAQTATVILPSHTATAVTAVAAANILSTTSAPTATLLLLLLTFCLPQVHPQQLSMCLSLRVSKHTAPAS